MKAGDAVEEGREPAFKERDGELWVGAFGRWYAWSWESDEMEEEERRARLAKGVVGMEVEDDEGAFFALCSPLDLPFEWRSGQNLAADPRSFHRQRSPLFLRICHLSRHRPPEPASQSDLPHFPHLSPHQTRLPRRTTSSPISDLSRPSTLQSRNLRPCPPIFSTSAFELSECERSFEDGERGRRVLPEDRKSVV